MRFYACRQEELPKRLRKDKTRILRLISQTGIEKTFPQYVHEFKSLTGKTAMLKYSMLRYSGPYQRLIDYLMINYPTLITIGRIARWGLRTLKKTFLGVGGVALLVIVGLYSAGALIEPARWYLVGIASALLLLCGGLLALLYVRLWLDRSFSHLKTQISNTNRKASDTNKKVSDIKKEVSGIKKQMAGLNKELSVIKDDVSIIGYDIVKEQGKLAEKVTRLETQASNDARAGRPLNESAE